ncbi:MAG TPA: DUF397 domain-containing protein [Thermopolyspora sp.]
MTVHMDFGDGLTWAKATHSGGDNSGCLYVCRDDVTGMIGMIGIRDSKHPTDAPQWYTHREWAAFLAGAKAGEFDHLLD